MKDVIFTVVIRVFWAGLVALNLMWFWDSLHSGDTGWAVFAGAYALIAAKWWGDESKWWRRKHPKDPRT